MFIIMDSFYQYKNLLKMLRITETQLLIHYSVQHLFSLRQWLNCFQSTLSQQMSSFKFSFLRLLLTPLQVFLSHPLPPWLPLMFRSVHCFNYELFHCTSRNHLSLYSHLEKGCPDICTLTGRLDTTYPPTFFFWWWWWWLRECRNSP